MIATPRAILTLALAMVVSAALGARGGAAQAFERPNILWITAEDMSADLGCYGAAAAHTPNLDALARGSLRFTRAFATASVCSPARSTLITGVHATTLGTQRLRSDFPLPPGIAGFPSLLRKAGYFTTNNVKTDYNTADEARLIRESWDRSSADAHWRDRPNASQPFFAVFNDMTTHQSRSMVWPFERFETEVQSELPPGEIHDPSGVSVPPYYPDTPVVRRTLARYLDCVTAMDRHVGRILGELDEDGLADDTIVFFFSDHGAGLPRHKRALYDSGLHVPLIVRIPEKWRGFAADGAGPGATVDELVSFVDFPPTVLALAGLAAPDHFQGRAFLGPATLRTARARDFVFGARDRVDEAFDVARSVRSKRFLYIRNFMPHLAWHQPSAYPDQGEIRGEIDRLLAAGELDADQRAYAAAPRPVEALFDVAEDPHQLRNLAGDPVHEATLRKMRDVLTAWIVETRDVGFLPETLARAEGVHFDPNHPLAARAAVAGPGSDAQATVLARDPDPAVRYWGMIGLRASGRPIDAIAGHFRDALDDPEPAVRIEAAAALGEVEFLEKELGSARPEVVLHAIRALQLLPPSPDTEAAHPAIRRTLETWKDRADETPLALFIRFSAEAILGIPTEF